MDILRLETIHPILVHLTVGGIPLFLVAYLIAVWKGSERWTFAGDVILLLTTCASLLTVAFGLVSNWTLSWPGGVSLWRWLHLALGLGLGIYLLLLGWVRLRAWRRQARGSGWGTAALALGAGVLALGNGWIGGEVLVYRAGMAVIAAGNGALAPPVNKRAPDSFEGWMGEMRSSWAAGSVRASEMMVHRPNPADFQVAATEAARLVELASWLEKKGPEVLREHLRAHGQSADEVSAQTIRASAGKIKEQAQAVASAARAQDLSPLLSATSQLATSCAGCHQRMRWNH